MIKDQEQKSEDAVIKFKKVFGTPEGEEVLKLLFQQFMAPGTFCENPNQMYFKEGQRDVVRLIMNNVDIDLEKQRKLFNEYTNDF